MLVAAEHISPTLSTGPASAVPSWLSVVSHLDPKYGGLSAAVPALASAVANTGRYQVKIAGFCRSSEHFQPDVASGVDFAYLPIEHLAWIRKRAAREQFRQAASASAGIHIHGLWQLSTAAAARAAHRVDKPSVISAHGMLESWALANKGLKKKLYAALVERSNLQSAACLHALTEAEASDYRQFGLTNPIAVIPNGVDIPTGISPELFLARFPALREKRLLLFLGRIHFKKGLDILAEAWATVSRAYPAAHLVLAGPDFEGTQVKISGRLAALGADRATTFTGMLPGAEKWSALAAAECFVLPSYSEGLSVSVLEAMGMGKPVIVTKQCNLPEVASHECGWTIEPRTAELASALEAVLRATAHARSLFGNNGRRLVADRYSWPAIGQQMADLYSWLGGGAHPSSFAFHAGGRQ